MKADSSPPYRQALVDANGVILTSSEVAEPQASVQLRRWYEGNLGKRLFFAGGLRYPDSCDDPQLTKALDEIVSIAYNGAGRTEDFLVALCRAIDDDLRARL